MSGRVGSIMQMRGMDCGALDAWCGDHAWVKLKSMHNTQMIGGHWRSKTHSAAAPRPMDSFPLSCPPDENQFHKTAWAASSAWPAWAPCWPAKRPHRAPMPIKHPALFSVVPPPLPNLVKLGLPEQHRRYGNRNAPLLSLSPPPPLPISLSPSHLVELGLPEQHGHRAGLPLVAVHHVRLPP